MTRAELKSAAKEQIKGNVGMYFVCGLIMAVISIALSLIPFVGSIAGWIVTTALTLGFAKLQLGMTRGEKVTVSKLFEGFEEFGTSILLRLLMILFICLWSFFLIIPGIIKAFSYSMSYFILADNPDMTALEAINESKEIMKGNKWRLFVLILSFILWNILGIVTLGIAYIYVTPYMSVTIANFYNEIKVKDSEYTDL